MGKIEWRERADEAKAIRAQIATLDYEREKVEGVICSRAHLIAKARHLYTRSGQFPRIESDGDYSAEGIRFVFSNGIDSHDDGSFRLTWHELATSPSEHARRYATHQRQEEKVAARRQLREAQARVRRAGA